MIATALGLPAGSLADTTLLRTAWRVRALRLTLAVLRDVFADDVDVRSWLDTPHDDLAASTPVAAIMAGREERVVDLAVAEWNELAACIGTAA